MRLALYLHYYKQVYKNGNIPFTIESANAYTIQYFDWIVKKRWQIAQTLRSARGYLNESI